MSGPTRPTPSPTPSAREACRATARHRNRPSIDGVGGALEYFTVGWFHRSKPLSRERPEPDAKELAKTHRVSRNIALCSCTCRRCVRDVAFAEPVARYQEFCFFHWIIYICRLFDLEFLGLGAVELRYVAAASPPGRWVRAKRTCPTARRGRLRHGCGVTPTGTNSEIRYAHSDLIELDS
jgi:hypothetical protein